jgi:hypothetical protein
MRLIAHANDATAFLSTAALIVGIFLTVTAAAFASSVPDKPEELMRPAPMASRDERYRKLIRAALVTLLVANTVGTIFPFTLLVINTVAAIQSAWIWVVFSYTVSVIFINLGAVSTMYLGPILARRRLRISRSFHESGNEWAAVPEPKFHKPAKNAYRDLSIRGPRWNSPIAIAAGIIVGILVGTRLKRSSK